jgi:predicted  nucleic acid-binding Zn-ribbon protein
MTVADFQRKASEAMQQAVEEEVEKASKTFETKIAALERKIESQELDVKAAESSVNQRRLETFATGGAAVIGMLTGRKRSISGTLSKNRMASAAKDRLEAEKTTLEQYKDQLAELMLQKDELVKEVTEKWEGVADEVTEITVKPTKSDIFSDIFAVVWLPYYLVEREGKKLELPAFRR